MPQLQSWLEIAPECPFSLANIPFGIISSENNSRRRAAAAIGDHVLDLEAFSNCGGFSCLPEFAMDEEVFHNPTLNTFAELGRPVHRLVRSYIQDIFSHDTAHPTLLRDNESTRKKALIPMSQVVNHLPLDIGDYTDFFAGRNHAFNVGTLFRGPENALQPNYHHLPVAYHGRASSVVVSGTPIRRPWGQTLINPKSEPKTPTFSPCKRLDIELELAMFVCKSNDLGEPVDVDEAEEYIFGYALMNDWSARDVQMWEYIPLGPFNAKNFGTTISPWVVLADALEPYKTCGMHNATELQSYLQEDRKQNMLDIDLAIDIKSESSRSSEETMCPQAANLKNVAAPNGNTTTISKTNARHLMWSWPQMIAHHSVGGCNLRPGDLFGSGTISGPEAGTEGSLLEQIKGGTVPLRLDGGEERKFLEDGDTVIIRGQTGPPGARVGFGECSGTILPARTLKGSANGH